MLVFQLFFKTVLTVLQFHKKFGSPCPYLQENYSLGYYSNVELYLGILTVLVISFLLH